MAETITIDISAEGVTTAQQLHNALAQQLAGAQTERAQLVTNQRRELEALDNRIRLMQARIAELREFIDFKAAPGG